MLYVQCMCTSVCARLRQAVASTEELPTQRLGARVAVRGELRHHLRCRVAGCLLPPPQLRPEGAVLVWQLVRLVAVQQGRHPGEG